MSSVLNPYDSILYPQFVGNFKLSDIQNTLAVSLWEIETLPWEVILTYTFGLGSEWPTTLRATGKNVSGFQIFASSSAPPVRLASLTPSRASFHVCLKLKFIFKVWSLGSKSKKSYDEDRTRYFNRSSRIKTRADPLVVVGHQVVKCLPCCAWRQG